MIEDYLEATNLDPRMTQGQVDHLIVTAAGLDIPAIVVNPTWGTYTATACRHPETVIVIDYPLGQGFMDMKCLTLSMICNPTTPPIRGADVVMPLDCSYHDLQRLRKSVKGAFTLRVIWETSWIKDLRTAIDLAKMAKDAGIFMLKTSTGAHIGGRKLTGIDPYIIEVWAKYLPVKAAGGINDLATAHQVIGAGASRIGTSKFVEIVEEERKGGG